MSYRIGVDIGGTFADFCALDEVTGRLATLKVLSTPQEPGREVITGLKELGTRFGIQPADIGYFTHGTTVGINSVIQRKGIRLCLITTENFIDVLELARLKMPDPYHLMSSRAEPLVTRDRVLAVRERILADGTVETPLDHASLRHALDQAMVLRAEGIVLALLHSYRNPAHEREAQKLIKEWAPTMPVFCSSDVWPIIREYERTATATIHGYVQPNVARYLSALQAALKQAGVAAEPMVTKSNGGVMTAELGKSACLQMLLSGTAAGVIGAGFVARQAGLDQVLSLDIGGTSADVAIIVDGTPTYGTGEMVGDFPIYIPTVSVTSIGDGGGSIAAVSAFGVLSVGPESAGSTPGPACYGRGGTRPTMTDAFAVCGIIGHGNIGYDAVSVDIDKARTAVGTIAGKLGRGLEQAAEAIIQVAVSGMYREVGKLASRQGIDPRDFTLLAFGGAGPMLGCFLARELGMRQVLVPTTPGVLSALGGLVADVKNDFISTAYYPLSANELPRLRTDFDRLAKRATAWITEEQKFAGRYVLQPAADMRYLGQSFEIEVPLQMEWIAVGDVERIAAAFHAEHERLYGHAAASTPVHMVSLRMVVVGTSPQPNFLAQPKQTDQPVPAKQVDVYLDGAWRSVPLYRRADLGHGHQLGSPCVVAQEDTTICIPEGFTGAVDAYGNILLSLSQ
ncbi:hydantoinase/oxoprolinase family protein [Reyranella sp.]|uniref:hydantoinase/oxoprolinase family protein n=1 Tax=Reyranella sp. TaxID=1929291 RepID=UPI003784A135